jgi:hypothetical protein
MKQSRDIYASVGITTPMFADITWSLAGSTAYSVKMFFFSQFYGMPV